MTTLLLPQPKQLSRLGGSFSLTLDTLVLIPTQADDETFFAAIQLQNETVEATLYSPSIVKALAPPREENVIMLICGAEQAASFGIEPVTIGAPDAVVEQSYALTITPTRAVLYADTASGLYYAVQTLRQWAACTAIRYLRCRSTTGPPCLSAA
jgi:hypothetical protein